MNKIFAQKRTLLNTISSRMVGTSYYDKKWDRILRGLNLYEYPKYIGRLQEESNPLSPDSSSSRVSSFGSNLDRISNRDVENKDSKDGERKQSKGDSQNESRLSRELQNIALSIGIPKPVVDSMDSNVPSFVFGTPTIAENFFPLDSPRHGDLSPEPLVELMSSGSSFTFQSNILLEHNSTSSWVSSASSFSWVSSAGQFVNSMKDMVDNSLRLDSHWNNLKDMLKESLPSSHFAHIHFDANEERRRHFILSNEPLFLKSYRYLLEIMSLLENEDDSKASFNKKLFQDMEYRLRELHSLLLHHERSDSKDPIHIFQYEYRGLLLIITHYLEEARTLLKESNNSVWPILMASNDRYSSFDRRGQSIYLLLELAIILESSMKEMKTVGPFLDSLNIEDLENFHRLNVVDCLVELGNHLVPQLKSVFSVMIQVTASQNISQGYKDYNALVQAAVFASANVFYGLFKKEAAKGCSDFFRNVDVDKGKGLWNLMEGTVLKKLIFSTLPTMKVSHRFQLPPLQDWDPNKVEDYKKIKSKKVNGEVPLEIFTKLGNALPSLLPENYSQNPVRVKLIANYMPESWNELNLQTDSPWIHYIKSKAVGLITAEESNLLFPEATVPTVIMFVHGGGFIAMSSDSHDIYTTEWVRKLKIPIVAVDYTNSPEASFPTQIHECWTVYKYIHEHSEEIFGCKVRVILAGDSAGGNLISALCLKAIHEGGPIPDGMVVSYPATYVTESPSPARLLGIVDPLVNIAFLRLCAKAYPHAESDSRTNPFLSPAIAPMEVLEKFPPVYINVGSLDPLFDDAIWFAKRLQKATGKVRLDVYDGMGHGYLAMIKVVPEVRDANRNVVQWIQTLINTFDPL